MNKKLAKSLIVFLIAISIASNFAFAEESSTNNQDTASSSPLEVTFPIQKDDFLLFYGVTKDKDVNEKIDSIRKDFMEKFQSLKSDYKKSINEAVQENNLVSPVALDQKEVNKVVAQVKKVDTKNLVKKYTLKTSDKASTTDVIISPIINTIDSSSVIHTENSSWFHKIKSIFNW